MARVTIVWHEGGGRYIHTAPTYKRFDDDGFGVRFYPADLPLIHLQVIGERVLNDKTKEELGTYDSVRHTITIERELKSDV